MQKETIIAISSLKERIIELSSKVENLSKSQSKLISRKYLNNVAVSHILHVSEGTLYRMRREGILKFTRIRRHIIYKASDIQTYIESRFRQKI